MKISFRLSLPFFSPFHLCYRRYFASIWLWIRFIDDAKSQSGLLENDDIIVSRRANSYVFTAVAKKGNGPEAMLKKAGAEGITVTSIKAVDLDTEKDAEIAVIPTSK